MNIIWINILIFSLGIILFHNVDLAFTTLISGAQKAIYLSIKLWAIYAVWLGLLKIVEDTKLDEKINYILKPIIKKLFGKIDKSTQTQISINLTANLLGMGNACTPSGIKALHGLDKGGEIATNSMIMFLILNTTSLQILPSTVIGLRIAHKSINPNNIIFPTLIATTISTLVGILLCKICSKIFNKNKG